MASNHVVLLKNLGFWWLFKVIWMLCTYLGWFSFWINIWGKYAWKISSMTASSWEQQTNMEIFLLTPNMTVEPKICQDILSWKQSRSGIQLWACRGWNEQMFCQQTDHCTTNFKTSGAETFTTFFHKSVFLQVVAETVLSSLSIVFCCWVR